jgi:hypothetical protein
MVFNFDKKRPQMWLFIHSYFQNLMWIITLFDFEILFFVIIYCKPMFLCYVWDGNLWILLVVGCVNVVSQVILIMAVLWKQMLHFIIFKFHKYWMKVMFLECEGQLLYTSTGWNLRTFDFVISFVCIWRGFESIYFTFY